MWRSLTKRILFINPLLDFLSDCIAINDLAAVFGRCLIVLDLISDNVIRVHVANEDTLIFAVVEIELFLVIAHQLNRSHGHMLGQRQLLPTVDPCHGVEWSVKEQRLLFTGVSLNGFYLIMDLGH
jgi:hypothetical protein